MASAVEQSKHLGKRQVFAGRWHGRLCCGWFSTLIGFPSCRDIFFGGASCAADALRVENMSLHPRGKQGV